MATNNGGTQGGPDRQPAGGGHTKRPIRGKDRRVMDIQVLLRNTNGRSARDDVWRKFQEEGNPLGWKDLISNGVLDETDIQRLWEIVGDHGNDIEKNLILRGTWSGKSWQISTGGVGYYFNVFKELIGFPLGIQDPHGVPLGGEYNMTIGGSYPNYTAKFGDYEYNALPNTMPRHLAFDIRDVKDEKTKEKTSSSDDQTILCIRILNEYVLVGQVLKGSEILLADLVLVKVKDGK